MYTYNISLNINSLCFFMLLAECRMAGTANDYVGTLSTTRSGRTCAKWLSDYDLEQMRRSNKSLVTKLPSRILRKIPTDPGIQKRPSMRQDTPVEPSSKPLSRSRPMAARPVHRVDRAYFNDNLYPERSVRNASNYCRDPSRNIAGTWCYTTDPLVPQDLCDVRDCEKPGMSLWNIATLYLCCLRRWSEFIPLTLQRSAYFS